MFIDDLINKLIEIRKEHGDIEVFDGDAYQIEEARYVGDVENYPSDYNMPKDGWVEVISYR